MNETQMPDGQEGVKRETNISHKTVSMVGDVMSKKKSAFNPLNIVQSAVILFLIFYGFFALTNPQLYPILGKTTQYSRIDPLIGFIMFVGGIALLLKQNR